MRILHSEFGFVKAIANVSEVSILLNYLSQDFIMKRIMIKFTKFFTAAAVVSLVFASCLDDNDDDRLYGEECYGMVEGTGKSFSVKTDGGNTLNVTETWTRSFRRRTE